MRGVYAHFRIRGLGVERLLDTLSGRGVILRDVKRVDARTVEAGCGAAQADILAEICTGGGFSVEKLPPRGAAAHLRTMKSNAALLVFAVVFAVFLAMALRFVWRVEIVDAGAYRGEVRAFLLENGIAPGIPKRSVDADALCDALSRRLPRVAWVRVLKSGVTLRVTLVTGVPPPDIESEGDAGDMIAARDGVIDSVRVYAGTACVKPGDMVLPGAVLISGQERVSQEETRPVRAQGQIRARVWVSAVARVSAVPTLSEPTGNASRRRVIASPFFNLSAQPEPEYLTEDVNITATPLGGAWFPLWLERREHIELALSHGEPDEDLAKSQAGAAAMRRLLAKCGGAEDVIDKWLDYSMIEGEIIEARATAELLADIAAFSPHDAP